MGIPVLIIGESGSGKTASLRGFDQGEIGILSVSGKPLPFRKKLDKADRVKYSTINGVLSRNAFNAYAIDDSQYLMAFEAFERAKENGYGKFTDIAVNMYNLIQTVNLRTSEDTIVYFLHHSEMTDAGRVKAKTIGKMLDSQLTLEGLFSIVLYARTDGTRYWFDTKSDGASCAKTPLEMFEEREIDNDLKMVDKTIREYYGLKNLSEKKGKE